MKMKSKNVKVTLRTHERLREHLKNSKYGWTMDRLINQLIDVYEMEKALQAPPEDPH